MVFGMELGEERCRSEHGEARTARRTNSSCTPVATAGAATSTCAEPHWCVAPPGDKGARAAADRCRARSYRSVTVAHRPSALGAVVGRSRARPVALDAYRLS